MATHRMCIHADPDEVCTEELLRSYQAAKELLDTQQELLDITYLLSCTIATGSLSEPGPEPIQVYEYNGERSGRQRLVEVYQDRVWRLSDSIVINAYGQLYASYQPHMWRTYELTRIEDLRHVIDLIQQRLDAS